MSAMCKASLISAWLTLFCCLASPAQHQYRQNPQSIGASGKVLLFADAGVRALDVYSTERMLSRGDHEMFLPTPLARSAPAMVAYSAGCVGAEYFLMRKLLPRHRRLARWAPLIDIAATAPWAVHNLFLRPARPSEGLPR